MSLARLFFYQLKCRSAARQVFARTKYQARAEDIKALARNMALLEEQGLAELNRRLIQANTKIFDTIAEHNIASMLLRHLGKSTRIAYEQQGHGNRPVDFTIQAPENTYLLQMKRFAVLEYENRQSALLRKIEQKATGINSRKFFDCVLREDFNEADLSPLVEFLEATAPASVEGVTYDYPNSVNVKAQVQFWEPKKVMLEGLTLGSASDMSMINVTGLASDQIRTSIRNASGAFTHTVGANNINLVIAEADKQCDIDVGEACFGTEQEVLSTGGRHTWSRQNDGIFSEPGISDNLVGLIILRRPDRTKPISDYEMLLYVNEKHVGYLPAIQTVFPVQKVIRYNMRPDKRNF